MIPTYQPQLLFTLPDVAERTVEAAALSVAGDRDHIFQRQLHPHLAGRLSSNQDVFVRRHWLVPSCRECNLKRSFSLEPMPYLLHLMALFVAAKGLDVNDCAEEIAAFADVARTAHNLLREQANALERERDHEA